MELRLLSDYVGQLPGGEWRDYQKSTSVQITRSDKLTYGGITQGPLLPLAVIDASSHRVESTVQDLYSLALQNEESSQDLQSDFVRILKQIDPGVQRLDLVRAGRVANRLQVKHEKTGATPLSVLGDGFRRALMIAVTIPTARGGILLIDELETALHVSVLDSVLGMLRWATEEFDVQVFATTHSLEAVDAVVRAFKEDPTAVVGYRLERPEGRPLAKRLSGEGLRELRFEMGLEFR
jgi:predicted ATPase